MTVELARQEFGDDYNDESSQLEEMIRVTIGESIDVIEIESWKDLKNKMPKGYELANEEDIKDYEEYMESRGTP